MSAPGRLATETPWTDPRPGDVCMTTTGRRREVIQVTYRGGTEGNSRPHKDRRPGDWVDGIVYEALWVTRSCGARNWAIWCRSTVKAGGTYEPALRGEEVKR